MWSHPLFRFSGETISEISLFPTIVGARFQGGCPLTCWVKLGRLEFLSLSTRPVRRWENVDFDLFLGEDLRHGRFTDDE